MGISAPLAKEFIHCVLACTSPVAVRVAVNSSEKMLIADLLITSDKSCFAGICTSLQMPHI
jgi:hypothetical protein